MTPQGGGGGFRGPVDGAEELREGAGVGSLGSLSTSVPALPAAGGGGAPREALGAERATPRHSRKGAVPVGTWRRLPPPVQL